MRIVRNAAHQYTSNQLDCSANETNTEQMSL